MSEAKPDCYVINRHLLVGITRLLCVFFLLERVPTFIYMIVIEIYNTINFQQSVWNSNARISLLGSIVENMMLNHLFAALIILGAVFLIWKANWLVDRIAPNPVTPDAGDLQSAE